MTKAGRAYPNGISREKAFHREKIHRKEAKNEDFTDIFIKAYCVFLRGRESLAAPGSQRVAQDGSQLERSPQHHKYMKYAVHPLS